jgi:hypothetical protein
MLVRIIVDQLDSIVVLGGETHLTIPIQTVDLLIMDDHNNHLVEIMGKIPHKQPPKVVRVICEHLPLM